MTTQRHLLLLIAVCLVPVLGLQFASDGLFTMDEFIYVMAAETWARDGSLLVENGFDRFGSNDQLIWFLVNGPNGLAPQYPPGVAILGGLLYPAFGVRGLLLVNAAAAVGVILITWWISRRLFEDRVVATVAVALLVLNTFFLDYAWALWPHMSATFCVLASFSLALVALDQSRAPHAVLFAALSGAFVGVGMFLRQDAFLVLPAIGFLVLIFAVRPVWTLIGGVVGLLPGVAALSLINAYKFGTYNILSYGKSGAGGGHDIASHLGVAILLIVGTGMLLVGRRMSWTRVQVWAAVLAGVVLTVLVALLPVTGDMLAKVAHGYHALVVDARAISDWRSGVVEQPDGTVLFWGVAKKALVQSAPWLGVLVALVLSRWTAAEWRGVVILLAFTLLWSLPFAALAWHGGFSSSMRYFLPVMPALSILAAALILRIQRYAGLPAVIWVVALLSATIGFGALYVTASFPAAKEQQAFTLYAAFAVAITAVMAALSLPGKRALNALAAIVVAGAIGMSAAVNLAMDVVYAQAVRATSDAYTQHTGALTGPALFYGPPHVFAGAIGNTDAIFAMSDPVTRRIDAELLADALDAGMPVYLFEPLIAEADLVAEVAPTSAFPDLPVVMVQSVATR